MTATKVKATAPHRPKSALASAAAPAPREKAEALFAAARRRSPANAERNVARQRQHAGPCPRQAGQLRLEPASASAYSHYRGRCFSRCHAAQANSGRLFTVSQIEETSRTTSARRARVRSSFPSRLTGGKAICSPVSGTEQRAGPPGSSLTGKSTCGAVCMSARYAPAALQRRERRTVSGSCEQTAHVHPVALTPMIPTQGRDDASVLQASAQQGARRGARPTDCTGAVNAAGAPNPQRVCAGSRAPRSCSCRVRRLRPEPACSRRPGMLASLALVVLALLFLGAWCVNAQASLLTRSPRSRGSAGVAACASVAGACCCTSGCCLLARSSSANAESGRQQ